MSNIVEQVTELITKPVTDAGYNIDEILYVKEEGNQFLRVVITKNGIIDVEDCVVVSKIINPLLDEADLIEEEYILDVCSKEKGCE
jgi:ribosome maturation factor RimP